MGKEWRQFLFFIFFISGNLQQITASGLIKILASKQILQSQCSFSSQVKPGNNSIGLENQIQLITNSFTEVSK